MKARKSTLSAAALGLLLSCAPASTHDPEPPADKPEAAQAEPSRMPAGQGEDWPRFLGPSQDGKSREVGIRKDWSEGLPILWQTEVGEGYSGPTVADGRLFLFDRLADNVRLQALDPETGERLWQSTYPTDYEDMYNYSGGPRTSPVIDGQRVFTFGPKGILRSQRVDDGEILWELDTSTHYGVRQNFFGVGSTPAIWNDLLIVQIGGSPESSPGIQSGNAEPNGTGIVAFDKETGEEKYRLADELASYASIRLSSFGGRDWAFSFSRGGLLGFEPATGKQDFFFPWRAKKLESVNASTPLVVGKRVFITESYGPGGALLEVEGRSVEVVWKDGRRNQSMASHWATPIHVDGVIYGCSGQSSGESQLRAVRLETGEVLWKKPGLGRTTLLHVDGHLVVLGEYGELRLVEATPSAYVEVAEWTPTGEDGKPLLAYPAWNGPVLSHGILYVRGKDRLLALELIPERSEDAG